MDTTSTADFAADCTADDGWRLIELAAAGHPEARERFCRSHRSMIRRWLRARWHHSRWSSLIGDAEQEVFLECLRESGALARVDRGRCRDFETYLHGVVRNVAARIERREARHHVHFPGGEAQIRAVAAREGDPGDSLTAAAVRASILLAMDDLERVEAVPGHSLAELLVLHFREEVPVRRIAAGWGVARGRVHEQRRRLCRRLRGRLLRAVLSV